MPDISFDNSPFVYLLIGHILKIVFLGVIVFHVFKKKLINPVFALVSLGLLFAWFYFPIIVFNNSINLDESVFVVGAMKLADFPIYWKYVDGNTSGPFTFYFITAFFELFHLPYDYINLRILAFLMASFGLFFIYLGIKKVFDTQTALVAILPTTFFLAQTQNYDFVHFSGERVPMLLLSFCFYLFIKLYTDKNKATWLIVLLGSLLGAIPYTKLQAAPIAFSFVPFTLLILKKSDKNTGLKIMLFLLSGLAASFYIAIILINSDYLSESFRAYVTNNLSYGGSLPWYKILWNDLVQNQNTFLLVLIALIGLWFMIRTKVKYPREVSWFISLLLFVTLYCVYKPGATFDHYFLFLLFPFTLFFALNFHLLKTLIINGNLGKIIISALIIAVSFGFTGIKFKNAFISLSLEKPIKQSDVSLKILEYTKPSDQLVIWGESGKIYLETKLLQGSKWCHTYWGMYSPEIENQFKSSYLEEVKSGNSPVILDAHKIDGFINRGNNGIETFPELYNYVENHYKLEADIDEMRIFVKKDLLK
jgi:hypothetical protein